MVSVILICITDCINTAQHQMESRTMRQVYVVSNSNPEVRILFATTVNVRFYILCINIDICMHCALYAFYEANKDDYYSV